ncbi:MAG: hypothetical protein Q9187_004027 [Circinaria calcarea]
MSPVSRSIIFFADGAEDVQTALSRILLTQKENSLLWQFLVRVQSALQDEYGCLPHVDRKGLPNFQNLYQLVRQPNEETPHPALHPTELVLVQLAHFIAAYEERPHEPYPDPNHNLVVGICIGELSAAAVSLAKSLSELLPLAVEVVRIAFRAGIAASVLGNELEQRTTPGKSWSFTISRDSGLAKTDVLESIRLQTGIMKRNRPYITSVSRKLVTIGGPPASLQKLLDYLNNESNEGSKSSPHHVNIHAPYHAQHLYSHESIREVLDGPPSLLQIFHQKTLPDQMRTCIGGVSGKFYSVSSRRDLLEKVLYDVLAQPILWENVVDGCKSYVDGSHISSWVIRPFGQTSTAKNLASTLKKTTSTGIEIIFDASFGTNDSQMFSGTKSPIAIVGMAGRFPNADSIEKLWEVLEKGLDCYREIPLDRFDAGTHLSRSAYGCFLDKPGMFDARFFNMSPREALQTDPGQRLALVTAYEALEMSGFVPNRTPSTQLDRVGTFYGQVSDEYKEQNMAQDIDTYFIPGSMRAFGPGRINHFFKFGGPAFSLDTACSSSSVALHVACNSIWSKDCDTAVVGGMNIACSSDNYLGLSAGHFLSDTGGCKTFDDGADGYCRGEAVASVVIKRLDAAQADNDNILGVILSTATNYSAGSVSITRPLGSAQETLYRKVLNKAGVRPFDIDYIEAHGTGTQAGDNCEMTSISNVFAPETPCRPKENPLYVGAVKANIGHSESASGVTALIKSLLVLRETKVPPHVGVKNAINHTFPDLDKRNLRIPFVTTDLPPPLSRTGKRRALVNNFSAAGGNTALVLESYPDRLKTNSNVDPRPSHIISVTGKSISGLRKNAQNLMAYLEKEPEAILSDLSYTTTSRRIQHSLRTSIVATSTQELRDSLASFASSEDFKPPEKASSVGFVFTGQGSLYSSLGKELFETSSQFRSDLIRFDHISQSHGYPSFLTLIDGTTHDLGGLTPAQTQLGIVAVQMGLCRLWASWGVIPDLVVGHSLGEYSALYACGVLTVSDTLYLVGRRAVLLESTCTANTHVMLSVHATVESIKFCLGESLASLEVACINGPQDTVLSGLVEVAEKVEHKLKSRGFTCKILSVPFAFHASQMDPIVEAFEKAARSVNFMKPGIPLISPLRGCIVKDAGIIDPIYLRQHLRQRVDFCGALQQCELEGLINAATVWLELGPHPLCLAMITATLGTHVRGTPALRREENAWTTACKSISFFHTLGHNILWREYHRDFESGQQLLNLPTHAFDEKNYWIEYRNNWLLNKKEVSASNHVIKAEPKTTTVQKLISEELIDDILSLVFETDLADPVIHAVIIGHLVNGCGFCPASVYADIALTVADFVRTNHKIQVSTTGINVVGMEIQQPIVVPMIRPEKSMVLRISALADLQKGNIELEYKLHSQDSILKTQNAMCSILYGDANMWLGKWSRTAYLVQKRIRDLENGLVSGTTNRILRGMAYKLFSNLVQYDRKYQGMHEVLLDSEDLESVASLKLYAENDAGIFFCSPYWIDSLVHLAGFIMNASDAVDSRNAVYISYGWGTMRIAETIDPKKPYHVHVKMQPFGKTMFAGDATIFQGQNMIGLVEDLKFQQVPRSLLNTLLPAPSLSHRQPKAQDTVKVPKPQTAPSVQKTPSTPTLVHSQLVLARTNTTSYVLNIIAEEIGISPNELLDDTDLSEFGMDSLTLLIILSRLREMLQMDLPIMLFQDYPTVGSLCQYFQKLKAGESDLIMSTALATPTSENRALMGLSMKPQVGEDLMRSVLRSTIAEQIGVEVEELLAAEDLSTLGVDSLLSLSIIDALRDRLEITIPQSAITGEFSMTGIEKALNLSSEAIVKSKPPINPVSSKTRPAPTNRLGISSILQGSLKTSAKNIFMFPDGSGSATSYAGLPEISPNICLIGLSSPYLRAGRDIEFSIEEITEFWLTEIRSRQSWGPYILAGWSAGGYYAFEATKRLLQESEEVEKLILIDSPPRNVYGSMPPDVLEFVSQNSVMGSGGDVPQWLLEHFDITLKAVTRYSVSPIDRSCLPKVYIIWASEGVMEDSPAVDAALNLSIPVTQFLLKMKPNFGPLGWEKLLHGADIMIAKTPGNHFSIVHPPNAQILSRLIAEAVGLSPLQKFTLWE